MADFLKSALGYLGSSGISQDNGFVGQYVELGDQKLRVKKVIAEGRCHTDTVSVSVTVTVSVRLSVTGTAVHRFLTENQNRLRTVQSQSLTVK